MAAYVGGNRSDLGRVDALKATAELQRGAKGRSRHVGGGSEERDGEEHCNDCKGACVRDGVASSGDLTKNDAA